MSRLTYLKEEENTMRMLLSKIQSQLDALAVEELALKSRIRRKQENLAKQSNVNSDVNSNASQSNSLKLQSIAEPDGRRVNNDLLDLEVNNDRLDLEVNNDLLDLEVKALEFVHKKEEEEESDGDDQMMSFIKNMLNR